MKFRKLPARLLLASVLASATLTPQFARAQGAPEQASAAAFQLFADGEYAKAAAAYEEILKNYPTSLVVPEAQFRLGYAFFLQNEYDKALTSLRKVLAPPASTEIQELGASLIPQVLSAQAGRITDEKKRLAAYELAIKEFDNFLKKYPNSEQLESVSYGKALALFQMEKYDEAAAVLRGTLQKFATSESILDSQYLLSLILATQGARALQENDKSPEGAAKLKEAETFLTDIINKRSDIALINEARFQLGEIFFNRAILGSDDDKPAAFKKALDAYRAVQTKQPMIQAQQARIAAIAQRKAQSAANRAEFKRLGNIQEAELGKLENLKGKGDLTVAAQIKAGQVFLQQKQNDEARVLLRQMQARAENEEQKKTLQYYITLTYAAQILPDKAVEAYNEFQSKYKGDPIAQNLPLVVGSLFVATEPEKAIQYFAEGSKIYPKGNFAAETVTQQANALLQMGRFEEAGKVFRDFLATKPRADLAAQAEIGLATVLRETGKVADATALYKKVRDGYKGTPAAEQSAFWVGQLALGKQEYPTAIQEFTTFLKDFPKSELASAAKFGLGQAESGRNDKAKALQIFKEVGEEFPKSQAAPYAFFQRAQILQAEQKPEEVNAILKEFIAKYPDHQNLYDAYKWIAQNEITASKPQEAIALYNEMVAKNPNHPQAPDALLKVVQLWNQYATSQGRYLALNEEQRPEWNKGVKSSLEAAEKLISNYPESPAVALALQEILGNQKLLLGAKLQNNDAVNQYFQTLAGKFESKPEAKNKILFTLASFTYETDKAKALEQMKAAYDPDLIYAASDIDLFGTALLESGQVEESSEVYQKLAANFPIPAGTDHNKASAQVQEAQSIALYGIGKALQRQGKVAEASDQFEKLKKLYPWSPKLLEANYGIAQSLIQEKQYDQAGPLLVGIIKTAAASAKLRANAMLLLAEIQEAKGELALAIDQFIKIAVFYESVGETASEGLWRGANLLEKQAATLTDTVDPKAPKAPTKTGQLRRATKAYNDLINKYPTSEHVPAAQARLKALSPK